MQESSSAFSEITPVAHTPRSLRGLSTRRSSTAHETFVDEAGLRAPAQSPTYSDHTRSAPCCGRVLQNGQVRHLGPEERGNLNSQHD